MRRLLKSFALAGCLAISFAAGAAAAEPVKIKFTLDWKLQGLHAWFYWAKAKGYFAAESLDVSIDQGEGSAVTVTRVMSGAYDAGFGDINAIIQNAATKPAETRIMVYMIYNKAPFALLSKASGPIKGLKDLEGSKLGAPAGGASFKLLPLLAKQNGVDYGKITITQVSPSLVSLKLDPDKDFRWMFYSDFGLDLYSNGVMVSPKLIKAHPEAIKGLLRAINRSLKETVEDPDAAIELLASEEPLIKKDIEKRRLLYVAKQLIDTPETRDVGLGDVSDRRLKSAISTIAASFELPRTPASDEVFDRSFLPAKADRVPPGVAP